MTNNMGGAHGASRDEDVRVQRSGQAGGNDNVVSLLGKRMEKVGKDYFLDINEDWMDAPQPGPTPMLIGNLLSQGDPAALCWKGGGGKSVMTFDAMLKLAYPLPGDKWMGLDLIPEGGRVLFVTREATLPAMQRLFHAMGGPERRAEYRRLTGNNETRLKLIHALQTDKLMVAKGDDVEATDYFKKMHEAMCEWRPVLSAFDTYSKLCKVNIDGNSSQAASSTDLFQEFCSTTSSAALLLHHVIKPGNSSAELKVMDDFRNSIKGSASFVDGLRNTIGGFPAWSKLADAVIEHGFAKNRKDVLVFGSAKHNILGIDGSPMLLVRGPTIRDGYDNITADFLASCEGGEDLMAGIAPAKRSSNSDDAKPVRTRKRGAK